MHILGVFVSYSLMIVSIICSIFVKNVPNKTKTFFYLFGLTLTNGNGNNSTKLCLLFDNFKSNYKSFRTLKLRERDSLIVLDFHAKLYLLNSYVLSIFRETEGIYLLTLGIILLTEFLSKRFDIYFSPWRKVTTTTAEHNLISAVKVLKWHAYSFHPETVSWSYLLELPKLIPHALHYIQDWYSWC